MRPEDFKFFALVIFGFSGYAFCFWQYFICRVKKQSATGYNLPDCIKSNERAKLKEGRERWVHEDHLIDHRLSWLGVTQSLLFTALGLLLRLSNNGSQPLDFDLAKFLLAFIPLVGLLTSFGVLMGVLGACWAMKKIRDIYRMEPGVSLIPTILGQFSALSLPLVFFIAWGVITAVQNRTKLKKRYRNSRMLRCVKAISSHQVLLFFLPGNRLSKTWQPKLNNRWSRRNPERIMQPLQKITICKEIESEHCRKVGHRPAKS